MSVKDAVVISTEPLLSTEAEWTRLVKTTYKDPNGTVRTWESAERQTRAKGSEIDGAGIVAIIQRETGPEIVLQKQYRPPVNKVVIEVPAGLIDAGETAEEAAVRELKEETGFVGQVLEASPIMFNDPGFCNTNLKIVHMTIDPNLPENQDPKPDLEDNEFIEVFFVRLADLFSECRRLEAQGYAIDVRVGAIAEGIELAKKFKL